MSMNKRDIEENQRLATSLHEHWVIFLVEWMLVSAIIDLILAAIIFAGLPDTPAWALGLLVGITIVVGGVALIAMALHAREIDSRSAVPAH
jgi:uncharacterized membrane protein HdeD (DUF308 family)